MGRILSLCRNHLFGEKSQRMLLAQIIRGHLNENSINSLAQSIYLNPDMMLQIKMILYRGFNERLSHFGKGSSSFGGKKGF